MDRSNSSQQQQPHPARKSSRMQPTLRLTSCLLANTQSGNLYIWRSQRDQQRDQQIDQQRDSGRKVSDLCFICQLQVFYASINKSSSNRHRNTIETALNENTLLPLYPVLQESDLTDQDPNLSHHREQFLDH
ncbi:hypothetical protein OUZ56_018653 [Daphnia magna]|uniref:Uncharacterized protein n=1 Tax=Daphnia magna TaxID=35525 RepID=A0ABQ9Z9F3_9CRUS|nr:hypothetical protein OUZ56_018653 [Daphnia magna]